MDEIWKDIKGYEGMYQISNRGKVKSLDYRRTGKERILRTCKDNAGYLTVTLYKKGNTKIHKIHRLVAEMFIGRQDESLVVNHKNAIRTDNRVENLEWCTYSENNRVNKTKHTPRKKKSVRQYKIDGMFLKIWDSVLDASKETNVPYANICGCCKGRINTAGGYIWKYEEDKYCKKCNQLVEEYDNYCKKCGARL